jgi:hypothetical protein
VYRRHTNFAIEHIEQTLLGTVDFGNRFSVTVSRNGDLINRMILEVNLPKLDTPAEGSFKHDADLVDSDVYADYGAAYGAGWVNWIGHRIIEEVSVEIGGQKIDSHEYNYNWAWDQLVEGDNEGYKIMVGADGSSFVEGGTLYVPIKFWFSDNVGLALPLIALQYHEVKINFTLASFSDCVFGSGQAAADAATVTGLANNTGHGTSTTAGGITASVAVTDDDGDGAFTKVTTYTGTSTINQATGQSLSCRMFVDYIYLDKEERRRFAQVAHEYLIEETQSSGGDSFTGCSHKVRMHFNHPVKELIWVVHDDCTTDTWNWYNYTECSATTLLLNNQERFAKRNGGYFTLVQPWQHHSNIPERHNVQVYSFAINPEDHQPSGTCNLSRIDNATLFVEMAETSTYAVDVYARNYNVLRVMSGMGGKAYSS